MTSRSSGITEWFRPDLNWTSARSSTVNSRSSSAATPPPSHGALQQLASTVQATSRQCFPTRVPFQLEAKDVDPFRVHDESIAVALAFDGTVTGRESLESPAQIGRIGPHISHG